MSSRRGPAIGLLVCLLFASFGYARINRVYQWKYPPLNEIVPTEHLAEDAALIAGGAHRLAADLTYVQFLQYYGTPEPGHDHAHADAGHSHDLEVDRYIRTREFGLRLLRLDPFFHEAILEMAGALAFNLNRTQEGLDYLSEAVRRDPTFHRYRLYIAAILFKNELKDDKLIAVLEEAITYPDCPPVLENVLGNLLKKSGRFADAARVYAHTFMTAAADADRNTAQSHLLRLAHEHPEVIPALPEGLRP